jgi:ABC-type multidrug transport system ATPase subunit
MSESILNALVQLFALISDLHDDTVISGKERNILKSFLERQLNNELVSRYMKLFDEYLVLYHSGEIKRGSRKEKTRVSLNAMKILGICEKINEELQQKQKVYVLIQLVDYISLGDEITDNELDFLSTVASAFFISDDEYNNIRSFIMDPPEKATGKDRMLVIDDNKEGRSGRIKHLYCEYIDGNIRFLHIRSTNTFIMRYSGKANLYLNGQNISPGRTYIFDHGSSIRGSGIKALYYTAVVGYLTNEAYDFKITLVADDVTFKFHNSENGIHNLNFNEESGRLVGILGGSGVGKSTTLSIMNGTLKPQKGKILINGYNLYDKEERKALDGVIGFVPQDDLLMEDLTVFQNLYYNAKMCLNNLSEDQLMDVVNKTLEDFDLVEIKELKVGNPLRKIISGGQRKRINIALELMREPTILFVDEPTSGLSSVDSEIVMNLLKEQTYKGKLVIVNIHQPSSEIYKMFDKLMIIDRGGYQIFYGNPTEAVVYFKKLSNHANPDEDQCVKCGNIDADQILQMIEAKVIDEQGRATRLRKVTPEEWAERFRKNRVLQDEKPATEKQELPGNNFSTPGLFKQSLIFFTRDTLSKLADKQYILIGLLCPPLLAVLLAYFTRYASHGTYIFYENSNILSYLFVCIITSLFFGLMMSSQEIVKDRKILKREAFLNLSWFSYLNSKIVIMFIISAIQTISFVLLGNWILGIRGMVLGYWLILFTTSCFANVLGLNISSAFNSGGAIYILIPFIIIPQLIFSGVFVSFDKLHIGRSTVHEYVPVLGDLMTARWSFEAIAVKQFRDNEFEKHFFNARMKENQNNWYAGFLIGYLTTDLWECNNYKDSLDYRGVVEDNFYKLKKYISPLSSLAGIYPGQWISRLNLSDFDQDTYTQASKYLDSLQHGLMKIKKKYTLMADSISNELVARIGEQGLLDLKNDYDNKWLDDKVTDNGPGDKVIETADKLIRNYYPIYMKATSKYGRAHFYAPYKRIGNAEIDTFVFNLLVIWIESIILYILLYFHALRKLIDWLGRFSLKRIRRLQEE